MSQAVLQTAISGLIAGVFALIGKVLEARLRNASVTAVTTSMRETVTTTQSMDSPNMGKVLIHIGILQLIGNIVGLFIGLIWGSSSLGSFLALLLVFGTFALTICFAWSGTRVSRVVRSIGVAIITLLSNSLILQHPISLLAVIIACLQTFGSMGIGGAIANAIKPN